MHIGRLRTKVAAAILTASLPLLSHAGDATESPAGSDVDRILPTIVIRSSRAATVSGVAGEMQLDTIRRTPARATGELLRELPGVDSVRRGPLGLDPAVRGLRETQVGGYIDGARWFPGGPGRMDSPLSHLDPTAIRSIEVEKGPYALTWGPGNLAAIRVETHGVPADAGVAQGFLGSGYQSNGAVAHGSGSLYGRHRSLAYRVHGVWRQGDDYRPGDGTSVPADFRVGEGRARATYALSDASDIRVMLGYQRQEDIDYPGRMLNARWYDVRNASARWRHTGGSGKAPVADALVYASVIDHQMDNQGKPSADAPMSKDIVVDSRVEVIGARVAVDLDPADDVRLSLGADAYRAHRDALRTTRSTAGGVMDMDMGAGTIMQVPMWPDAAIADVGVYATGAHSPTARTRVSVGVRADVVVADADAVTDFYIANVGAETETSEFNLSASGLATYRLSADWSASVGVGSVARTADAKERYSDRVPATRAQMSAEFMGNPTLAPERGTQADLWLEGGVGKVSVSASVFARRIDNYITLEATALTARMATSPDTVYRYVNGGARFIGGEAVASAPVARHLVVRATLAYLWGEDTALDEPALGVSPPQATVVARYTRDRFAIEAIARAAASQDRVSVTRGEAATERHVVTDLLGEARLGPGLVVRGGALNVGDATYVNHLNARNPFTKEPVPEPGRVVFTEVAFAF
ncbi:TonB-dependent receptor [Candidatus Poribacteria bacterium]|nr:TonB-dependent receptor [Candidatus Poribacteria bacterium]MBT5709549.1 TonB-dependent receptor [Candidatus Poribacteria bacterium]MBT7101388.1 TonB-dependent receptor [Candidatus Poribacteria bacterium]MBT7806990.1 TonB-dependent receptor [Candidatus Poribacteria bacterium]